ncbi:hypothetical protein J437_LFUL019384 [Ladona fulva]|nr:hypothetical protein J437_LFUL019384 [Ladona fulva]
MGSSWLTLLSEIENKVKGLKVSSSTASYVSERVDKLRNIFIDVEITQTINDMKKDLKKELIVGISDNLLDIHDQIKEGLERDSKNHVSYADKVKHLQQESKEKKEVVIEATDETQAGDAKAIKQILQRTINPAAENIRIEGMRTVGKKRVVIQTTTQEEKDKITQGVLKQKLEDQGLKVQSLKKEEPKVIVFSIDRTMDKEEFRKNVYKQNFKDHNITEEDFKKGFRYAFTKGRRDTNYCNLVFQVTPEVRDILITKEKLYAGWMSHYIKDYLGVTRCYKCQGYGHSAQFCREKMDICRHCSKPGHTVANCPNKEKKETCANCHRFGHDADHPTNSRDCPAYRFALEKEILRTGTSLHVQVFSQCLPKELWEGSSGCGWPLVL